MKCLDTRSCIRCGDSTTQWIPHLRWAKSRGKFRKLRHYCCLACDAQLRKSEWLSWEETKTAVFGFHRSRSDPCLFYRVWILKSNPFQKFSCECFGFLNTGEPCIHILSLGTATHLYPGWVKYVNHQMSCRIRSRMMELGQRLELPPGLISRCLEYLEQVQDRYLLDPNHISAALIYLAGLAEGVHIPQAQLARIAGTQEPSLRRAYRALALVLDLPGA